MKSSIHLRPLASLLVIFCLLAAPLTAFAKKGDKNFKRGMQYEAALQWEQAAQEFTLAIAADPANLEYQLHYRRALFNASQAFMMQGRSLAEQRDYIGAYNAFRQAYAYDPVNQLALSEMDRMMRLQDDKTGASSTTTGPRLRQTSLRQDEGGATPPAASPTGTRTAQEPVIPTQSTQPLRIINYSGDLKSFIRSLADQLNLNVIFDSQSFRQPRTIEINLKDVTTGQALDMIFLQEGLFFQKLSRRTILVADQTRRPQYQQLVIRTFYLSNVSPEDARNLIVPALPPSQGRPNTIVLADKSTNSLTVRDTSENVRLIGEILQSIDKDRAEVVMDVNIYEVSRTDLLQFGNQIGTVDSSGNVGLNVAGTSALAILGGSRQVATQALGGLPTALGAALIVPPSSLTALQRKDHTRLLASTQIHAFNNDESTARIGQRVPVQTAQTFPTFGNGTGTGGTTGNVNPGVGFSGGIPVFNYEPTGLTLKFTPQVFPNLDVQVKMSIESKEVFSPGATPTFTERTITGTARIQNNRTMLLASVAQDKQSNGRQGLPILGLIPVLGRLFTSPRRDNSQVDIVIAVTPRVLRAPAVTPRDEMERPSGTLQTPTTGSLEAMVQEADREDQLAAARQLPTNASIQLPDAEPPTYVPAPATTAANANTASVSSNATTATQPNPKQTTAATTTTAPPATNGAPSLTANVPPATNNVVNAVASLIDNGAGTPVATSDRNAAAQTPSDVANKVKALGDASSLAASAVETGGATQETTPAYSTSARSATTDKPASTTTQNATTQGVAAELRLAPERQEMRVGEKQRIALMLTTGASLNSALVNLVFDPKLIAVRGISQGDAFKGDAPTIMQSINPSGTVMLTVAPPAGAALKPGAKALIYLEIEAISGGEAALSFEQNGVRLITTDGRNALMQFVDGRLTVKP